MRFFLFHVNMIPEARYAVLARELTDAQKNHAIKQSLQTRESATYWKRDYRLTEVSTPLGDANAIVGKIAVLDKVKLGDLDDVENRIIEAQVGSWKWTHFIYFGDLQQTIAVMDKPEFFTGGVRGIARILSNILNKGLDAYEFSGHTLVVRPKTDEREFWDVVDQASGIYSLRLDLVTPNAHGGEDALTEFLQQQRTQHNATEVTTVIANSGGELRVDRDDESLRAEITYAARGAGKVRLTYRDAAGRARGWKSDDARAQVVLPDGDEGRERVDDKVAELKRAIGERELDHRGPDEALSD